MCDRPQRRVDSDLNEVWKPKDIQSNDKNYNKIMAEMGSPPATHPQQPTSCFVTHDFIQQILADNKHIKLHYNKE